MEIPIGSKWLHTRTNNQYEVVELMDCNLRTDNLIYDGFEVWYKDQQGEIGVRTEKEFLDSFKPYKDELEGIEPSSIAAFLI